MSTSTGAPGCGRCGAGLEPDGACSWCGAPARPPAPPCSASAPASPRETPIRDRIAAFRASPAFERLAVREIALPPVPGEVPRAAFGAFFAFTSVLFIVANLTIFGDPFFDSMRPLMLGVPAVFVVVGIVIAVRAVRSGADRRTLRVRPVAAAVISSRTGTDTTGGRLEDVYFVGLEFADGSRDEFPAEGPVMTTTHRGEVGVALFHAARLIAFRAEAEAA